MRREVVEMRRRLEDIMRLAEVAAHVLGEERVEELLDAWAEEKITTEELKATLRKAIEGTHE